MLPLPKSGVHWLLSSVCTVQDPVLTLYVLYLMHAFIRSYIYSSIHSFICLLGIRRHNMNTIQGQCHIWFTKDACVVAHRQVSLASRSSPRSGRPSRTFWPLCVRGRRAAALVELSPLCGAESFPKRPHQLSHRKKTRRESNATCKHVSQFFKQIKTNSCRLSIGLRSMNDSWCVRGD